jgi:NAD(P)-dependent dehydrogenase (short-subunit alcohol dehydrogenase family)
MAGTILVCGHGPGISHSVAQRFGSEGYSVALVARNKERIDKAAEELNGAGIQAQAFACDLGDPDAVRALVKQVRTTLGPIEIVHWNAYATGGGDLLQASDEDVRRVLSVAVSGLIAATQAALPDLKAKKGAVLITGGGFAYYDNQIDAMAVQWSSMALAMSKAAQHKLAGLLHHKLAAEGVYVGEVVVAGVVIGTAFDRGQGTLEAGAVADRFWELLQKRTEVTVRFPAA